jgi:hypothetical protein
MTPHRPRVLLTILERALEPEDVVGYYDPDGPAIYLDCCDKDRLTTLLHEVLHWLLGHDVASAPEVDEAVERAAQAGAAVFVEAFPVLAGLRATAVA